MASTTLEVMDERFTMRPWMDAWMGGWDSWVGDGGACEVMWMWMGMGGWMDGWMDGWIWMDDCMAHMFG